MLKIDCVCVGKIKDACLLKLIEKYCLRLEFFCRLRIIETPKLKNRNSSVNDSLQFEEKNILKKVDESSYKIALCVEGAELSSEEFASEIEKLQSLGFSKLSFVIGGAFGLSETVKQYANFKMSLSKMTLPHQLARLFLLEQLYRAMTILSGSSYHK